MRIRKFTALVGCAITFLCCVLLYRMADRSLFSQDKQFVHTSDQSTDRKSTNSKKAVAGRIHGGKLIGKSKNELWNDLYQDTCPVLSNEVDADIQVIFYSLKIIS